MRCTLALQPRRPPGHHGQHRDDHRDRQQHDLGGAEAEAAAGVGIQIEATARVGMVRPMLAIADPIARLSEVCTRSRRAALDRRDRLGQQHEQRDHDTDERHAGGRPRARRPRSPATRSWPARRPRRATAAGSRATPRVARRSAGRRGRPRRGGLPSCGDREEEVAVAHGLGHDEREVEGQRGDGGEGQLPRGELRPRLALGDRGQHEAERGQGRDGGQRAAGALGVEPRRCRSGGRRAAATARGCR